MIRAVAFVALATLPAAAQEPGWQYSPYPGEGDRAAMGCASGSDETQYACVVVRCEDDFSVGLHIHTSRAEGDAGAWRLGVDETGFDIEAVVDGAPYGARVSEDPALLIQALKDGAVAYLDPQQGTALAINGIPLSGSLYAINQALYFCAPRNPDAESLPQETR